MLWEDVKAAEEKRPVRHPNRELPEAQTARLGVVLLLALTIAMLLIVAIGGWSTLVGAKALHLAFMGIYGIFIFFVIKWNRGVLPVIAGTAVILGVFALVAGPAWFARDKTGYASPALPDAVLGVITLGLIPVQMLLIVVAMWGFSQKWNVEEEIKPGESATSPPPPPAAPTAPAAAG
ncbi:MAG: hypothetical protein ACRDKI_08735 [Solirubrobacterales bacterium]